MEMEKEMEKKKNNKNKEKKQKAEGTARCTHRRNPFKLAVCRFLLDSRLGAETLNPKP